MSIKDKASDTVKAIKTGTIDDIKTAGEKLETAIKAGRGRPKKCTDEVFLACDHLSVKAAAEVLEMSIDAVRKRRIRMKLESERKRDDRWRTNHAPPE